MQTLLDEGADALNCPVCTNEMWMQICKMYDTVMQSSWNEIGSGRGHFLSRKTDLEPKIWPKARPTNASKIFQDLPNI